MLHTFFTKNKKINLDIKRVFMFSHDENDKRVSYKLMFEENPDNDPDIIRTGFIENGEMLEDLDLVIVGKSDSGDRAFFFVTVTSEGKYTYREYENYDIIKNVSDRDVLDSIINDNRWSKTVRFFKNKLTIYIFALLILLPIVSAFVYEQCGGYFHFSTFTLIVKCVLPCVTMIATLVLFNSKKIEVAFGFCVALMISLLTAVTLNVSLNGKRIWFFEYDNTLLISASILIIVMTIVAYSPLKKISYICEFLPFFYGLSVLFSEYLLNNEWSIYWLYSIRKLSIGFAAMLMWYITSRLTHYKLEKEFRDFGYNEKKWVDEENDNEPSFFFKLLNSSCGHSYHKLKVGRHYMELEVYGLYKKVVDECNDSVSYMPILTLPSDKAAINEYIENDIDSNTQEETSNVIYITLDQDENIYYLERKDRSYSEIDTSNNNIQLLNELYNSISTARREAEESDIARILEEEGIE